MFKRSFITAISTILIASSAHAAFLTNINGTVLVNKGHGFKTVVTMTKLKPNDRVLVRGEGSAEVIYGINCVATVQSNQTFVVPRRRDCRTDLSKDFPASEGDGLGGAIIIGGIAIGGTAIIATNRDNPASP